MEDNKEMNIFTMFGKIGMYLYTFLRWVGAYIGKMLQLTYRYKFLCVIFFAIATALAIYQTTGDRKIYRGDMTIAINDGNSFQYAEMVNSLNQYVKDLDNKGLSQTLNISEEIAKEVCFIKPYFLIDMNKDSICDMVDYDESCQASDTSNVRLKDGLVISVGMKSIDHYNEMEDALMEYFFDNQYFQDLNIARIAYLSDLQKSLDNDFQTIDSLQKIEYFQNNKAGVNILKDFQLNTDKQMFYFNKVDILRKKNFIATELTAKQDIAVVTAKFQPTNKAVNGEASAIGRNILYSYLIFILLALFLKNKKEIMDYLKEKK